LARLAFTEVVALHLPDDFVLTERQAEEAAEVEPNVVFVCSPNNPTGNAQPVEVARSIAERLPSSLVVVDEAYVEFGGESALPLVTDHPNVVVVRTFSKAFSLAGARLGYALTSPDVVDMLERVRLPYHVSALAQTAGAVALRHGAEAARMVADIVGQRERISDELGAIPNVRVWPSQANFVLFEPPGDAVEVWRGLLDRGVLVRDLTAVVPGALRVTAGAEHEVDLFLKALKEVLGP
jgi:histidinol-phosphate aminotransferase